MSRRKTLSRNRKFALLAGAAVLVGGTAVVMTGTSQASVACDGLASAFAGNERFIAEQRATPDALSEARIANREEVLAEIRRKQAASGCAEGSGARETTVGAAPPAAADPAPPPGAEADGQGDGGQESGGGQGGDVVCAGSTVTLSGEGGAPAASSDRFPLGTRLKVTNLDNSQATTVEVTSVSGSCVLLNDEAFEQVREPGKFLIRRARIERVG
ncbi:hypothetical protein OG393_24260 [Streptomyces sp. NBC_01216]|uniref:hypothetical protein n=1 Tax=Streptomyces sp. NBC_01216 TaxID=2903778 RepID=UPI002E11CB67|nr:hypothetical protein OG393_24260 [Streptomyces sp. NBC_01216]